MAFSRTAPRHEIAYLRRVPKVGEARAAPAPAAGPSLALGRTAQPAVAEIAVRRVRGRTQLRRDAPAATLDRRQSAIGSLAFELVGDGELSCCWELVGGDAGLVSRATDVLVSPEFGRRPIVQLVERSVVVGLRHVRRLRRLLLLVGGERANATPARLVGELVDGSTVESAHAAVQGVTAALAIYHVAGELVIRREDAPFRSLEEAAAAYGMATSWLPPVTR